jgi:hypothetical protein
MLPTIETIVADLHEERLVAPVAWDAQDAFAAEDDEWVERARSAANALLQYAARVAAAVGSKQGAAEHLDDRDDIPPEWRSTPSRPTLRAVR